MAEEKKKEKGKEKPTATGWNFDSIEGVLVILLLLSFLTSALPSIYKNFISGNATMGLSFFGFKLSSIYYFFKTNVLFFKILGFSVAGAAAVATFVLTRKADSVWREEKTKLFPNKPKTLSQSEPVKDRLLEKWEKIIKLSESENSSDWRLAIIEADIILDELLEKLQLPGETMGEKLKAVEKSDFLTIESAWEAHKARNMIAHEGDFILSQRETRRIISLYEAVFKEFYLI